MRTGILTTLLAVVGLGFLVATAVTLLLPALSAEFVPLSVLLAGVVTAVAVAIAVRRLLLVRLARMTRTLRRVRGNNFVIRCEDGNDELGSLGREVNSLLQHLTDLSVNVIDADRELQWAQKELKLQEELAEKGRLLQDTNNQLETRLKELSLLFSVSRSLSTSLNLAPLLESFSRAGARAMEVDRFAILIYDERSKALVVSGSYGFHDAAGHIEGMRFYPGEGISGTVYEKRTMLYIRDLAKEHRFLHFRGKTSLEGSLLALPLPSGDKCLGVMLLNRTGVDAFSFEDVGLFHIIANQVASAVGNAVLYRKTLDLAIYDELTGLYNRRMLERRLEMEWERAQRFGTTLTCIMVDVDHFKQFNDEHGHLVGDQVLRHAGQLVLGLVRKVDTVARFGGEEFSILLPRTEKREAYAVAEKLRHTVESKPTTVGKDGKSLAVTISVGVASTEDGPGSATELIDMADNALLLAKSSGRNRVVEYGNDPGVVESGGESGTSL
jgi:diguanylate cyclase (GGDEF)-like protein